MSNSRVIIAYKTNILKGCRFVAQGFGQETLGRLDDD